jgi:hypothetical protein
MPATPSPVAVSSGATNSPSDCRAPMVIIMISAAMVMNDQARAALGD